VLSSSKRFDLKSENHIFKALGFSEVEEDELPNYIDSELLAFLRSHYSISNDVIKPPKPEIFSPVLIQNNSTGPEGQSQEASVAAPLFKQELLHNSMASQPPTIKQLFRQFEGTEDSKFHGLLSIGKQDSEEQSSLMQIKNIANPFKGGGLEDRERFGDFYDGYCLQNTSALP